MSTCLFCKGEHKRLMANSKTKQARYCSTVCIKRASYVRRNPGKKSMWIDRAAFDLTETGIGLKWEQYVAKKLNGTHHEFNKEGIDVSVEGRGIDVKVCEMYRGQWAFNRNKPKNNIDQYYCICLVNGKPVKELLIPSKDFASKGITIGKKSRYDVFKV